MRVNFLFLGSNLELNILWLGWIFKDCFDKFIVLNWFKINFLVKSVKSLVLMFEILIVNFWMVLVNGFLKYEKKEKERKVMNEEKRKNGLCVFDICIC